MINLLQMQDKLKDMSDRQLASEMQSGMVPQYLVLSELQRRQKMRQTAKLSQQGQQPQTTVADEIESEFAPNEGVAALPIEEPQFASGGIVSFGSGGDVPKFEEGGSPFSRWWNQVSKPKSELDPEWGERQRLMTELSNKYNKYANISGLFREQSPEQRQQAQSIMGNLDKMSLDQMRVILGKPTQGPIPGTPAGIAAGVSNTPTQVETPAAPAQDQTKLQPPAAKPEPKVKLTPEDATPPSNWKVISKELSEGMPGYPALKTEAQDKAAEELLAKYEKNKAGAADQAMIAAGLAMMAGKSPYALQNIGAGGIEGLKAYKQEQKDLDELQKGILGIGTKKEEAENLRAQAEYKAKAEDRKFNYGIYALDKELASKEDIARLQLRAQYDATARNTLDNQRSLYNTMMDGLMKTINTSTLPAEKEAARLELMQIKAQLVQLGLLPGSASTSSQTDVPGVTPKGRAR